MVDRYQRFVRDALLVVMGIMALAALIAHAAVNARAAADYRTLGTLPVVLRSEAGQVWTSDVAPGLTRDSGLQSNDRVLRIAAEPVGDSLQPGHALFWRDHGGLLRRGQRLSMMVLQDGLLREVSVPLRGISAAQARALTRIQAMMLPKQVAGFCLYLLGVLVLFRRRDATTRIFFLWCMALALYTASSAIAVPLWISYPQAPITLFRTGFMAGWFFAPALFGQFCLVYGGEPRRGRRLFLPAISFLAPLVAFVWIGVLSPAGGGTSGRLVWFGLAGSWLAALTAGLITLFRARRRTRDSLRRKQLQLVLAGSLAYVLVFLQTFVGALIGWDADPTAISAWLPHVLLLVTPLALAYAILRHRLLDLGVIIRRSLVYTGLTLCMGGLFIVLQQLVGAMLQAKAGATSLPAQTLAAMVVAALFGPAERRLGRVVESNFNRRKLWRLQRLHQWSQEIRLMAEPLQTEQILVDRVPELFAVERSALLWWEPAVGKYRLVRGRGMPGPRGRLDWGASDGLVIRLARDRVPLEISALPGDEKDRRPETCDSARLTALGAALCVPLSAGGRLAGILILGARPDDDVYSAEEKEALLALGDHAAAALRQAEMERRLAEWEEQPARPLGRSRPRPLSLPRG